MDSFKLKEILFKKANTINKNKGLELYKNNNVIGVQGKNISGIYNIYGKVKDENKEIRTHVRIDLSKAILINFKCTCSRYELYSKEGYKHYCPHIIATAFKVIDNLPKSSEKISQKIKKNNYKDNSEEVFLDTKIHYKNLGDSISYEVQFKIGSDKKYLINDINGFIEAIENNKTIKINENFIFSNKYFKIAERDLKLINLIISKYKKYIVNNKLKLSDREITNFIEAIGSKEIVFKENFLEYNTSINRSSIPFIINLKEDNNNLTISTEKSKPIAIGYENNILLFKRQIYIIENNKDTLLSRILNEILKDNTNYFPGNKFNILEIIYRLNLISSKINIDNNIRNKIKSSVEVKFYLYKKGTDIFCNIYLLYGKVKVSILDNNNELIHIRDERFESDIINYIKNYGFISDDKKLKFLGNDYNLFDIIVKNKLELYGDVILGKGLEHINIYDSNSLEVEINKGKDEAEFSYRIDRIEPGEFPDILFAFKEGKEFYRSKNGSFINLLDTKLGEFFTLIDTLDLGEYSESIKIDEMKLFILENTLESKNLSNSIDINSLLKESNKDKKIKIKKSLEVILRDYQLGGVKWLRKIADLGLGGILADDMGLGKTLQTITFLSTYKKKKTLIIVPTSLIYNWRDEFFKFAPWINISINVGSVSKREEILKNYKDYDVIITTYGKFKSDIEFYKSIEFDFIIIDEGQNIKNHTSQNARYVKMMKAKQKFVLSGTPIENNLLELWSIFDFIMPSLLYSKEEFIKRFNKEDQKSLDSLNNLIKPFILRRTKNEVAKDLPNKYENRILVELSEKQRSLYDSYIKIMKTKLTSSNNIEIFSVLTKLRLACLHTGLLNDEYNFESAKFIKAKEIVYNNLKENKKILIFSQFTSVLDLFEKELDNSNIKSYILTGKNSPKERIELVNNFNDNDDIKIFLISLKAGGVGLNLTSANTVIHFDPWWNPAVENQASDRAHRIGQKNEVEVIKLIAKDTIEEKIVIMQEEKKNLINDVLTNNISQNNINKETIKALIESYI